MHRFEASWVRFETKLAVGVLIAEILSLCAWIFLKGLSTPPSANKSGVVFRAVMTATALGMAAWFGLRNQPQRTRTTATTIATAAGLFLGRVWANVGVEWGSEVLNWYQDASTLTLIGGLRGVGTRLTAWLAMLGASLATSSGKHINIDVFMRFLPQRVRVPAAVAAWCAAAVVCFAACWGFVDHIALASMGAPKNGTPIEKIGAMSHEMGEHFFLLRKQMRIDLTVGFRVFIGKRYAESLSGREWNDLIDNGGYEAHYKPEEIKGIRVPDSALDKPVAPLVVAPGKSPRGLLVEDLNLLFPFGFFMLALKFLLRSVLAVSGHVVVDPDAAHRDESHDDGHTAHEGGA